MYKGNYLQKELTAKQEEVLAKTDRMAAQFKSAEVVVMAFPYVQLLCPSRR